MTQNATSRTGIHSADSLRAHGTLDLTAYSAKGGCSCKLPPAGLAAICDSDELRSARPAHHADDDAAIVEIGNGNVLVSSVDFQNPALADSYLSGQIAANNALSDIFACGIAPQWAEVILAVPALSRDEQVEIGRAIMEGIAVACRGVGCQIVGGHTIVLPTPLIGLAVRGIGLAKHVKRKAGAQPGDRVLISKPLGTGIMVASHQVGFTTPAVWAAAKEVLLQVNSIGAALGACDAVTSMTDVTGFGFLGHSCEVAAASEVSIAFELKRLPRLGGAVRAAAEGLIPELAAENWKHVAGKVRAECEISTAERGLLCDPQTNGGLLFTVNPAFVAEVQHLFGLANQTATVVGTVQSRQETTLVTLTQ